MNAAPSTSSGACPHNGQVGRKVSSFTLTSQVRPEILDTLPQRAGFRFCATEDCPVVYYHGGDGTCITVEQMRLPVFQKNTDPQRPVCYCFCHSVAEINDQVRATGGSTVPVEIKEQCAKGLDACERNNPQGLCCLGNVQKVVKAAQATLEIPPATEGVIEAACDGCCAPAEPARKAHSPGKPVPAGWLGLGVVFSAVLASACCWLPLVLLAFGASAAGVAGFFEQWRPLFLGVTAVLMGAGFYVVYLRKEICAPGSACARPRPGIQQFNRLMLWLAAAFTLAFAAFPKYASYFIATGPPPAVPGDVSGTTLVLNIQDMTCEACASGLQETLRRVPGVRFAAVDYRSHAARLIVDPEQMRVVEDAALSYIQKSGYQVALPTASSK